MFNSKKSKTDKLSIIKAVLNGSMSFEVLRKPQHYFVTEVDNDMYEVEDKLLTKEQFEEWKKITVRDIDSLIMFCQYSTRDYPTLEATILTSKPDRPVEQIQPQYEAVNIGNTTKHKRKKKRIKQAKDKPALIPQEQPAKPIKPALKTYGLMSEYGSTWGIDKSKYVEETTEPERKATTQPSYTVY